MAKTDKTGAGPSLKHVRTTISLDPRIWDLAANLMESGGFNGNFSQFVSSLVREHAKRAARKRIADPGD